MEEDQCVYGDENFPMEVFFVKGYGHVLICSEHLKHEKATFNVTKTSNPENHPHSYSS